MSKLNQLLKQAQEMKDQLEREVDELVVEASVGGGMVTVRMTGHRQLVSVRIDPEVMDRDDPSVLEDLIVSAVNEAGRKVQETMRHRTGTLVSSMPSLFP